MLGKESRWLWIENSQARERSSKVRADRLAMIKTKGAGEPFAGPPVTCCLLLPLIKLTVFTYIL